MSYLRESLFFLLLVLPSSLAAFFYPNAQASLIDHILVDVHGAYASNFSTAITPCTNYVSGSQILGRETAAQWLRVAFHDFVTADVSAGTGGMDASIGFETLREEDSGSAFNDSLAFFRPYVNKEVSMADLIALSVSLSIGNCGGPQIPVRSGRIDATGGGAFGVPAPETDLDLTLEFFASAGFDQVSAIGLTACGHTLGSVHHGGFPTVVGIEAVTATNTAGGIHFDATVDVFDAKVVNEYLDGTGNAGGPLVTSFNVTSRSDLRLYESDGNATMIELANQGAGFLDTCATLMQRMVETVPTGVVLSDVISPLAVKPINTTLDFDENGSLFLSGNIRILASSSDQPKTLILSTNTNVSKVLKPEQSTGTSVFGTSAFFPFSIQIPSSTTTFNIAGQTFAIHTNSFVIPSLSGISTDGKSANFTMAVKKEYRLPTMKISAPLPQMGTLSPAVATYDIVTLTKSALNLKDGYAAYSGSVQFGDAVTGSVFAEVLSGDSVIDTAILNYIS
ncbi:peroxidase-5 [Coleophoma crateriformis]|uniref:Peroxidase n=1 Tax=Coleophoma crateriformis TaxID=565419 RepID=A0A3D8QQR9_9HELO|nr:peroxidase-5 [Coleophoma crateriformis]